MNRTRVTAFLFLLPLALSAQALRDVATQAESRASAKSQLFSASPEIAAPAQTPANSLVFIAMTPCRLVDTRAGFGFTGAFGTPSLVGGATRAFPIQASTTCTIPSIAQAYSINVTVAPPGPIGYLTLWPVGTAQPNASTLNDSLGGVIANAAIIPAGNDASGSVNVFVTNNTDLIVDINGYYAPQSGITLTQGTAAAPSLSFASDPTTGIFSSGAGAVDIATGGIDRLTVRPDGDVDLPGSLRKDGVLFLHNLGIGSTAVGLDSLGVNIGPDTGSYNTAVGMQALSLTSIGSGNSAVGSFALGKNTGGIYNTASGYNTLGSNTDGGANTAVGQNALPANTTGNANTAVGVNALLINTTGFRNIAIGYAAAGLVSGINSNNIHIGSLGALADNGVIRIGDPGHTAFYASGVRGIATGNNDAVPVVIDSNGQLGTVNSSIRFKEDIHDMADASSGLLRLRPVSYRYKQPYADGSKPIDYGLIAEEVAEIYPDLAVKGSDGQVETVQYQKLTPMLLNELQKEHQENSLQSEAIRLLQTEVAELKALLSKTE